MVGILLVWPVRHVVQSVSATRWAWCGSAGRPMVVVKRLSGTPALVPEPVGSDCWECLVGNGWPRGGLRAWWRYFGLTSAGVLV
jgi:hypothetical protein